MGIAPLYIGINGEETWFASELKALEHCSWFNVFPIGSKYDAISYTLIEPFVPRYDKNLFKILRSSVDGCLNTDVPWGVLLSGGLHSSIISSLTRFCDRPKGYPILHTFSVGLENSIELIACKYISKEIRSVHHKVTFGIEEGLQSIVEAVYIAETHDLNMICKCIPLLILAKHIARAGIKMVLSGLGANEIFSEDTVFTGSIINKCMQSQGITCLVPFLTSSVIHMADAGLSKEKVKEFFKECVPKYSICTVADQRWVEACEQYGENKIRLIYNTVFPGR
jgi:asparagine synthase (glutamine-hydrolysing)